MADPTQQMRIQDILNRLGATNSPFMRWLQGKNQRGEPIYGAPGQPGGPPKSAGPQGTYGRGGGYRGWVPGMPNAPGTSYQGPGRYGGAYKPSGNMPVPVPGGGGAPPPGPTGGLPAVVGGGGNSGGGGGAPPRIGVAGGPTAPGNPLGIPGFNPRAAANVSALGLLGQTIKPQPAGGPGFNSGGTPVNPTGPLPSAASTFNGNMGGQSGPAPISPPVAAKPSTGGTGQGGPTPPPWNNPQPLPNATLSTPWSTGANVLPRPRPPMPQAAPGQGKGAGPNIPLTQPRPAPLQAQTPNQPMPRPTPSRVQPRVPLPAAQPQNQAGLDKLLQAIFGHPKSPQQVAIDRQAPQP